MVLTILSDSILKYKICTYGKQNTKLKKKKKKSNSFVKNDM